MERKIIVDLGSYDTNYAAFGLNDKTTNIEVQLVDLPNEKIQYENKLLKLFTEKSDSLSTDVKSRIEAILHKEKNIPEHIKISEISKDVSLYLSELNENSIDIFHSSFLLENLTHFPPAPLIELKEILKKLKPNGQFEIITNTAMLPGIEHGISLINNQNEMLILQSAVLVEIPETTFEAIYLLNKERTPVKAIFKKIVA